VDTAEELLQRVQNGCTLDRNIRGIFKRVRQRYTTMNIEIIILL
jgi:hypothetical protein